MQDKHGDHHQSDASAETMQAIFKVSRQNGTSLVKLESNHSLYTCTVCLLG